VRIRRLTLQNFRNIGIASLAFEGPRQFLVGANGQGKTNLLEAAGFLTALRSFRTSDARLLVMSGQSEAGVSCEMEDGAGMASRITVRLREQGRELEWDGVRVARLADHLGRFPTVVFSSEDLLLVRGPPSGRRRWLDLTISAMDPDYLRALQTYSKALAGRNQILRAGAPDVRQLLAFERMMAPAGAQILAIREAAVGMLGVAAAAAYSGLTDSGEEGSLAYLSKHAGATGEILLAALEAGRARDLQAGSTMTGPHRDDLVLEVRGSAVRDFGSEGQQRSLVLALRLAQAAWFKERSGIIPVLLADDVLGELDPARRKRFWTLVHPGAQIIATGTEPPSADFGRTQLFTVAGGVFTEDAGAGSPIA